MYFEEVKLKRKSKTYRSFLIRESYRFKGKVCHRTVCNISQLPAHVIEQIRLSFKTPGSALTFSSLNVERSREYGASFALLDLARQLGLDKLIYSRKEPWRENALALIIGRIVCQGSKLSLVNMHPDTALWELCGHCPTRKPDVDEDAYEVMDHLLQRQEAIQRALVARHIKKGALIYYDMTSTYFEGEYEGSDLVTFGYNRDRKRGHEQVAIGLLTDSRGCPVAVEVFRGNTNDQSTVAEQARRLSECYGVKDIIFAGDRGMLTPKRIEEVSAMDFKTLTALSHPQIVDLLERKVVQLELFDEEQIAEVRDPDNQTLRYLLCKNPKRAAEETETRKALVEKTRQALDKIASSRRKHSDQDISASVGVILKKWHTGKFFTWSVDKAKLSFEIKHSLIETEESLDGCYIIRTDVSDQLWSAQEAVEHYRGLAQIERAFRNLKTVSLEMRPVYHQKDDRIRAHVFLCMLAYYIQWHALDLLKPLFEENGEGKHRCWTWPVILEQL